MNIILLSGGSGSRLWPLSNNIRSKQFIKLFKDVNGNYQSMLQRVYSQIKKMDKNANILVATAKSQVSAILSQLGNNIEISVEPSRKDTFPAIALSCMYLKEKLNIGNDEPVVVCPIDPYVDDTFYDVVKELSDQIKNNEANLALCGIEPSYPSEKFGYIIPKSVSYVSEVNTFKEKPNSKLAKEYIDNGALWNGGVFAFKLGYILKKTQEEIKITNYQDLYDSYNDVNKISFDYAVVEKEKNIKVVKYKGLWKDLGTWDTLTESMNENVKGSGIITKDCQNVHVINETNLPIIVSGLKDVVVAASPDGILASNKESSLNIKPYVSKINMEAMYAEKSWGRYRVLEKDNNSATIKLTLYANCCMGYHSHRFRDEKWIILDGEGFCTLDGETKKVGPGDIIAMNAGVKHKVEAITELKIIEVQLGSNIKVEDKIKWTTN